MLRALPLMLEIEKPPLECNHFGSSNILIAIMFNFEIDTLEIALHNYCGYADVMLVEGTDFHNSKLRAREGRPLLWPLMRTHPRFQPYSKVVKYHVVCKGSRNGTSDLWESERTMDRCMSRAASRVAGGYKNIVVGSVDEILSRRALTDLNTSPVMTPRSSMTGMFLSSVNTLFKSDWPNGGNAWSFSLPTVYPANVDSTENSSMVRIFKAIESPPVVGGAHLTNYCLWPNRIIKEATTSDYGGGWDMTAACAQKSNDGCYHAWSNRKRHYNQANDLHAVIPPAVTEQRYPVWFGESDPREKLLFARFC